MKQQQKIASWGRLGLTGLLLASSAAYADISGKVFRDFNANGTFDTGAGFNEVGAAGVTVKAFDASGAEKATATSGADGSYTLTGLSAGTDYRVEFTWAESWLKPGAAGGTSVQFVKDGASDAYLAVQSSEQYCQASPNIAIPRYINGDPNQNGSAATAPAWSMFNESDSGTFSGTLPVLAQASEVGSLWGMAYQRTSGLAFGSAVVRRHVGLGKIGGKVTTGGIYAVDTRSTPYQAQPWLDVNTLAGVDTGMDPRQEESSTLPADKAQPNHDVLAFTAVGKRGLGDLDISEDNRTLYTINLKQRTFLSIDIASKALAEPALAIPNPGCANDDYRPWGIGVHEGQVYVGVVCSAETSRNPAELHAHILRKDGATFVPFYDLPLNYNRAGLGGGIDGDWRPWARAWTDTQYPAGGGWPMGGATPVLSDIVFDVDGSMILGFLDRTGMQSGLDNYSTDTNSTLVYESEAGGDILRVCRLNNAWVLEGNAGCQTAGGTGNNQGPNGSEFYFKDELNPPLHTETAIGGLALRAGSGQVIVNAYDPVDRYRTGGVYWLDNLMGTKVKGLELYGDGRDSNHAGTFGKAVGLGDLELLCDPAPLEIGNRVWRDANANGIQDAGEAGIDGVEVTLTCGSDTAKVTTSNGGQFLFSNKVGGNATFMNYGEDCELAVADGQGALAGLQATAANADSKTSNDAVQDVRDSDAVLESGKAVIRFKSGGMGENNHGLDVGYREPPKHSLGNRVWFDLNDNGKADSGENHAGDGIKLELRDKDGKKLADTTTDANGRYLFHGLSAGQYQVCVTADNFAAGSKLAKYRSSTGQADADSNSEDGVDRGDDSLADGVCSTVTVLDDKEPTKEYGFSNQQDGDDGQGTPDAQSNLTLDFGFVPPADVELSKVVDKASIKSGEEVTYTLTVINKSAVVATGVKVADQLPAKATLLSATASQGTFAGNEWDVGNLPANGSATLTLKVKVE